RYSATPGCSEAALATCFSSTSQTATRSPNGLASFTSASPLPPQPTSRRRGRSLGLVAGLVCWARVSSANHAGRPATAPRAAADRRTRRRDNVGLFVDIRSTFRGVTTLLQLPAYRGRDRGP